MGGDCQSEQRDEADSSAVANPGIDKVGLPTTPDTGNTGQIKQRPDAEHESHRGDQPDDQSDETSVTPPQQKRGRFLDRLRKRRSTDSGDQAGASTERAAKKPKIGLLGIVITALVGFFFGIASNQVTEYIKRADECVEAIGQYVLGMSDFPDLSETFHDQALTQDQRNAAVKQYNTLIIMPYYRIEATCPVRGSPEYLNSDDVNRWNDSFLKLKDDCFASECSQDKAQSYLEVASNSTAILEQEAHKVSQWGLLRRAKYEVTHLY